MSVFSISDIMNQLGSLFSGGQNQGNGVTTFAAPDTMTGMQATGGLLPANTVANFGGSPLSSVGASGSGLGLNMGTAGLALGGLQSLSSILSGNKALDLAKDQFKLTRDVTNTNLNNQIKTYNTSLEDRLRSRGVVEGTDALAVQAQIDKNRLSR